MSDKAREIAERVAMRLSSAGGDDSPSLRASIDKLNERLYQIESKMSPRSHAQAYSSISAHPSMEKFNLTEAVVEEMVEFFEKEKMCSFEPNGKICDHCSMCSSRGF